MNKTKLIVSGAILLISLCAQGCSNKETTTALYGPGRMHMDGTPFTPGVDFILDEGAVLWYSPDPPTPGVLGWATPDSELITE